MTIFSISRNEQASGECLLFLVRSVALAIDVFGNFSQEVI